MATILCTGVDPLLVQTRKLILERAGHHVTPAVNVDTVLAACQGRVFDVAVIGQAASRTEKKRIFQLVRQHCPTAKVLELYVPARGKDLPDANEWLEVPVDVPAELAERVAALAGKSAGTGSS
jgi:hypothetical protein